MFTKYEVGLPSPQAVVLVCCEGMYALPAGQVVARMFQNSPNGGVVPQLSRPGIYTLRVPEHVGAERMISMVGGW
jgi:hypothetical protein